MLYAPRSYSCVQNGGTANNNIQSDPEFVTETFYNASVVDDDFSDGNYDGWTVTSGTWTAASGYLDATTESYASIRISVRSTDLVESFSYERAASGSDWYVAIVTFRFSGDTIVELCIYPGRMLLRQKDNGVWTTLDENTAEDTLEDTWYDVRIETNDSHIAIWRGESGQPLAKVLETDECTVDVGVKVHFYQVNGGDYHFDNIYIKQENNWQDFLHIENASPCKDTGTNVEWDDELQDYVFLPEFRDFDNQASPLGTSNGQELPPRDMGADEYPTPSDAAGVFWWENMAIDLE